MRLWGDTHIGSVGRGLHEVYDYLGPQTNEITPMIEILVSLLSSRPGILNPSIFDSTGRGRAFAVNRYANMSVRAASWYPGAVFDFAEEGSPFLRLCLFPHRVPGKANQGGFRVTKIGM